MLDGQAATLPRALLRRLEWRVRHAGDRSLSGDYRSAFRGKGSEFDQVVPYEFGDDIRDIDWNVTARRGELFRKKFVEERELTLVLLFEDRLTLQFGSGARTKRDTLLECATLFALLAAHNRDRLAYWHATPRHQWVHRPVRGRHQVIRAATELISQAAPSVEKSGEVEMNWRRFAHAFPRHSLVLWLGDFPPRLPPPAWQILRKRYEVIGVRAEDAWERELPETGALAAVDPETGERLRFEPRDARTRERHADWRDRRAQAFRELFPRAANGLVLDTAEDPLRLLTRFFRARQRAIGR